MFKFEKEVIGRLKSKYPNLREVGGTGIRGGLKIPFLEGSIPSPPTIWVPKEGPLADYKTYVSYYERLKFCKLGIIPVELTERILPKIPPLNIAVDIETKPASNWFLPEYGKSLSFLQPTMNLFVSSVSITWKDFPLPCGHIPDIREQMFLKRLNKKLKLRRIAKQIWRILWPDCKFRIKNVTIMSGHINSHTCLGTIANKYGGSFGYFDNLNKHIYLSGWLLWQINDETKEVETLGDLDLFWTLLHELIHARWPTFGHGYEFIEEFKWAKAKIWSVMM